MAPLAIIHEDRVVSQSDSNPLPFISTETQRIGWGGYSTVYKEIIVSRHFAYCQEQGRFNEAPLPVARKWFPYRPDFDREYALLKYLKSARKPHERVVKHLAVVLLKHREYYPKVKSEHNLLFPLADMHLGQFMSTKSLSECGLNTLLNEVFNLADALDYLHRGIQNPEGERLSCWHMDLAPSNILVFNYNGGNSDYPVGVWKITDFSSSNLIAEDGRPLLLPPKLSSGAYVAPEIHQKDESLIEKSCDIWSFGCVLFDVLLGQIYGGDDGLAIPKSYYFEENEDGDVNGIAHEIKEYLDVMESDGQIVLLCKCLVSALLQTDPAKRPSSQVVRDELDPIIQLTTSM